MKLNIKKWLYLLNDTTNLLLEKDKEEIKDNYEKLKKVLVVVLVIFIISFLVNIYLLWQNF